MHRFIVQPHALCALNSLPQSTIHTTPHLLHTRVYLLLLPSPPPPLPASVQTQLAHERALARFGAVTKEADPGIRAAYVALAELGPSSPPADAAEYEGEKEKKSASTVGSAGETVEAKAVGRYFEDAEWDKTNLARGPMGFPVASGSGWKSAGGPIQSAQTGTPSWWSRWGNSAKPDANALKANEAGVKVG